MSLESENNFIKESQTHLSDKEVADVVAKINDERLRADEDAEHFTVHLADRIRRVPKRTFIFTVNGKVISWFRNHRGLKYPYGYYSKQRFQLCGQLFERQEVYILRLVQGVPDAARLCALPPRDLWKTEILEATS